MASRKEKWKTMHSVFDDFTNRNIYKLIRQGYFEGLIGLVSIGKEANVFSARTKDKDKIIIKIHRLETSDFNKMYEYLHYDPRYATIKNNRRLVIFSWAQREFRNMVKARDGNVRIPKPIGFKDNIVMQEFIGDDDVAPKLNRTRPEDPKDFFDKVVLNIRRLYKAGLVHTDLSPFNILNYNENPVFIDFSQCTTLDNPNALEYLRRDVKNVCDFFRKQGMKIDDEDIMKKIIKK